MRVAEHLRYLVLAAQREGNRRLASRLAEVGVTPAQAEALRIIGEHGPLSLRALGDMLVCDTGSSPSRIVDRLAAAGLVHRAADGRDRRQISLTVSPAGRDVLARVIEVEDELYASLDAAAAGRDVESVIAFLADFTRDSPAGLALAKRTAAGTGERA